MEKINETKSHFPLPEDGKIFVWSDTSTEDRFTTCAGQFGGHTFAKAVGKGILSNEEFSHKKERLIEAVKNSLAVTMLHGYETLERELKGEITDCLIGSQKVLDLKRNMEVIHLK